MDLNNPKELPEPNNMLIEEHETDGILASNSSSSLPKRAFLHWSRGMFILLIGAIIGILLGGSVILMASKNAKPSIKHIVPQALVNPTPTTDETINWKTYTSTDNSYSFKYPSILQVIENKENKIAFYSNSNDPLEHNKCIASKEGDCYDPVVFYLTINKDSMGYKSYKTEYEQYMSQVPLPIPTPIQTRFLDFQKRNWTIIDYGYVDQHFTQDAEIQLQDYYTITTQVGLVGYSVYLHKESSQTLRHSSDKFVKQILSTFKLININTVISPTMSSISPSTLIKTVEQGQHCGGNMANPPQCHSGYRCAPNPKIHNLPFGDVGGICTRD